MSVRFLDLLGLLYHSTVGRKAYQHVRYYQLPTQLIKRYV